MKLNLGISHPSAFISSTFIDLKCERKHIANKLKERSVLVNALDVKPASNNTSRSEIISGIRESDFIILIIADRYGSLSESITGEKSLSITWWEYNLAFNMKKPVLVYFKNPAHFDEGYHDDKSDPQYTLKRTKFEHFKKLVTKRHNPAYFDNEIELSEQLDSAIIPTYRNAVSKLLRENNNLRDELARLETKLEVTKPKMQTDSTEAHKTNRLLDLVSTHQNKSLNPLIDFIKRKDS